MATPCPCWGWAPGNRLGYRHIDCASDYANEPEVGAAIRGAIDAGEVSREELWITSKLWCNAHGRDNVEPGVAFPTSRHDLLQPEQVPLGSTWEGMEAALEAGLTRHIGVSNFSSRKLQQPTLVADCAAEGVHITAYSPLGSQGKPAALKAAGEPVLLENPVIGAIAAERGSRKTWRQRRSHSRRPISSGSPRWISSSACWMARSGCWRAAPGLCRPFGTKTDQRLPGLLAVDDAEMAGTGSRHRIEIDALIEAHKTASMVHGQGQEIGIGDLAWPQQALPANDWDRGRLLPSVQPPGRRAEHWDRPAGP